MGWLEFGLAFAAFFLSHSLPTRPRLKSRLVGWVGGAGFTFGYSLLSLAMLSWVLMAAGRAPIVTLWEWARWQNHVPLMAMGAVCLILAFGVGRPNPFSFGGRNNHRYALTHPGITRWVRHPILLALLIWSVAHIVPNGDLAHVIVFSVFAGFSVLGMKLIDRRTRRTQPELAQMAETLRRLPWVVSPRSWRWVIFKFAAAITAYIVLLHLHELAFGVTPLP